MLDDMLDHMSGISDQPVWRDPTGSPRDSAPSLPPQEPTPLHLVHERFKAEILPFSSGNAHPGFMGWVQGAGSPVGMLAEMLAAGLNANLGGRDHMALQIEREVIGWTRELLGLPLSTEGLFVTGASAANHIGVLVARTRALGGRSRARGLGDAKLTAYTSSSAHECIARAMEMTGIGSDALRRIPVDADQRIDQSALRSAIARDQADGAKPFLLVGNAGTVGIGAIDDLHALADTALAHDLHFHVDGAFGALAMFSPRFQSRLHGLGRADSLAIDWHKWGQVPYEAGCVLVRDRDLMRRTFHNDAAYLARSAEGLAAGEWWPCDYGPDLSRGFKALKVWFTWLTHGAMAFRRVIENSCDLAAYLAARIRETPELELRAPVPLNIVVFGWAADGPDGIERRLVERLHLEGRVAPSLLLLDGRPCIRACFINHRSGPRDVDALIDAVVRLGRSMSRPIQRVA